MPIRQGMSDTVLHTGGYDGIRTAVRSARRNFMLNIFYEKGRFDRPFFLLTEAV